jgi:hypothetical protein
VVGASLVTMDRARESGAGAVPVAGKQPSGTKFTARVSMIMTGIISFLYQLSLFPLYSMIALQQANLCQVNDLLHVFDIGKFSITLGNPSLTNRTAGVTGMCLTVTEKAAMGNLGAGAEVSQILFTMASRLTTLALSSSKSYSLSMLTFTIDTLLTYSMGVITGIQDLIQVSDTKNCRVPDYYLHSVTTCACGDDPVQIPLSQRTKSLTDYAHWCVGTLKLSDEFGKVIFVYNKYPYQVLLEQFGSLDDYLRCLSQKDYGLNVPQVTNDNGNCEDLYIPPLSEASLFFSTQGVTMLSVFQRCKSNYQQKQWDAGAFLLYDETLRWQYMSTVAMELPTISEADVAVGSVGRCLLDAYDASETFNTACMQDFVRKQQDEIQWSYIKLDNTDGKLQSQNIDACMVFTGPAKDTTNTNFIRCANHYSVSSANGDNNLIDDRTCTIPMIIWSGASSNKVPVAAMHYVQSDAMADRETLAQNMLQQARQRALSTLDMLQDYSNDNLDVVLFSVDGDRLHQIFDCIVMGAYARFVVFNFYSA